MLLLNIWQVRPFPLPVINNGPTLVSLAAKYGNMPEIGHIELSVAPK